MIASICRNSIGMGRIQTQITRVVGKHVDHFIHKKILHNSGIGCGSVGRVVASDTSGPQFESSHWQILIFYTRLLFTDVKKQWSVMAEFLKVLHYLAT